MSAPRRTGILGGTFDPIHAGHLAAADAACRALALDEVLVVPSHEPPHRAGRPLASAFHRFAMAAIAAASDPRLVVSDLELGRPGPSFTADTLRTLHASGLAATQLYFILGTDAFAEIATWHGYPGLLDLAHFAVISRPGQSLDALRARLPRLADRMRDPGAGLAPAPGDTASPRVFLVQSDTPNVSSTDIRARAADGRSLAGLVTPEVERHILRHRLYASESL
jgi:nicotinate-nucleotide adenylyltransferase